MFKKILVVLILLMLIVTGVSCGNTSNENNNQNIESSEKLQILKTDLKLTQEQVMSRIKAQYLIENNGYKDSDEVIVMIKLNNESLIDTYNSKSSILRFL